VKAIQPSVDKVTPMLSLTELKERFSLGQAIELGQYRVTTRNFFQALRHAERTSVALEELEGEEEEFEATAEVPTF
jgi:hypothetical protein